MVRPSTQPALPVPPKQPIPPKPRITPKKPVQTVHTKQVVKKKGFEVAKRSEQENNATKVAKTKPTKPVKKTPQKKITQKKTHPQKHHAKKRALPKRSKDRLANALLGSGKRMKTTPARKSSSSTDRMIARLYGREFYTFTKTQKRFIKNHLSEIYRITQNTLYLNGYPEVAVRTRQQGVNVVSFYLHPNGSISNLRLVKPMGYEALDKNTIAVIQIAYKDYPRPKTKTKIVFYVNYQLY